MPLCLKILRIRSIWRHGQLGFLVEIGRSSQASQREDRGRCGLGWMGRSEPRQIQLHSCCGDSHHGFAQAGARSSRTKDLLFFLWIIVRCMFSMSTYGYPCNAITRILVSTMDLFCSCCASLFALFRCQLVLNAYVLLHILFMTHIPFKVFQSSLNGHHVIFVSLRRTLNIS